MSGFDPYASTTDPALPTYRDPASGVARTGGYPPTDPRSADYYAGDTLTASKTPPWIQDGYPDFDSWSAAITAKKIPAGSAGITAYQAATTGEQQRQFNETFGMDKAKYNQDFAERQRQFNEQFGMNKARGDQQMQLDQAKQKWQEAVDSRDFNAAEYWKGVTNDLNQRQFSESQLTNDRSQSNTQNRLALDYTQMLASKSGPQDYVKYWKLSHGVDPTPGNDSVPMDQAIPAWARPQVAPTRGGAPAIPPMWAQPQPSAPPASTQTMSSAGAGLPAWMNAPAKPVTQGDAAYTAYMKSLMVDPSQKIGVGAWKPDPRYDPNDESTAQRGL